MNGHARWGIGGRRSTKSKERSTKPARLAIVRLDYYQLAVPRRRLSDPHRPGAPRAGRVPNGDLGRPAVAAADRNTPVDVNPARLIRVAVVGILLGVPTG